MSNADKLANLVETMIENDPDDIIADGGHVMIDLWRHDARQALASYRASKVGSDCELSLAIERDRSSLAGFIAKMDATLHSRDWMLEGRGPYEWDDDQYKKEFHDAAEEIRSNMKDIRQIAKDWTHCPTDPEKIKQARASASKDDDLVERLEKTKAFIGYSCSFETNEDCHNAVDEAIARLQAAPNPWVKIEDIPESMISNTMKDGMVDLMLQTKCGYSYSGRIMDDGEIWTNDLAGEKETPAYASHIPPAPPQEGKS